MAGDGREHADGWYKLAGKEWVAMLRVTNDTVRQVEGSAQWAMDQTMEAVEDAALHLRAELTFVGD